MQYWCGWPCLLINSCLAALIPLDDSSMLIQRLACLTGLSASVALTTWSFHKVEPLAGLMLLPYLAWAIFATFLSSTLINLNPQACSKLPRCAKHKC